MPKSKSQFKKDMREYYNICVDPEPGETFDTWFSCLWDALLEDGSAIKINGRWIVKD